MLHTGIDHHGKDRTAVCCLSSVNLEKWDEWSTNDMFIQDIMRFLDNVLEDFIKNAPDSMKNAAYSAKMERSVGLGAMGYHSFLQKKGIPFESAIAKSWNIKFFRHLKQEADKASVILAIERVHVLTLMRWVLKQDLVINLRSLQQRQLVLFVVELVHVWNRSPQIFIIKLYRAHLQ